MALDAGHQERRAPKSSGRMSMSNGPLEIAGGQTFLLRKNKCHLAARERLSFTFCFSFLARHVGRDWTVCYWGLAVSRPALMPKYCSSQTSRSSFNRHAKILERERERIDLSGCTCMESESRTLEESWSPYAILFTSKFFVFVLHFLALSAWRLPWVSWSWPTDI